MKNKPIHKSKMSFVRTFVVNIIPEEITIERLRNSMEYLGSICRIEKIPYITDDGNNIGWNAYIYYESWKPCKATLAIDDQMAKYDRRNLICFIDTTEQSHVGNVNSMLSTPTITVYPFGDDIKYEQNYLYLQRNKNEIWVRPNHHIYFDN